MVNPTIDQKGRRLVLQLSQLISDHISKYPKLKSILFPIYEKFGFKNLVHKNRNKQFQMHGFEIIKLITNEFNKAGVKYWLDYGTLLGIIRDQQLIEHDMDLDLGIMATDYSEKIDNLLYKAGFSLWRTIFLAQGNILIEKTFILNNIRVDLFLYYKQEDRMIAYSADNCPYLVDTYKLEVGEFMAIPSIFNYHATQSINHEGNIFFVPTNPQKYLKKAYGNWENKSKNFNYLLDSPAVNISPDLRAIIIPNESNL